MAAKRARSSGRGKRPLPPRYPSAGQSLLRQAHKAGILPQAKTAEILGISQQHFSAIVRGSRRPSADLKTAMAAEPLEIDVAMWRLPAAQEPRVYTPVGREIPTGGLIGFEAPELPEPEDYIAPDFEAPGIALSELQGVCARLRRTLHEADQPYSAIDPAMRIKYTQEYQRAIERLGKLTRELGPADESKLAQTATFHRFVTKVLDALDEYPEARAAVAVAFDVELDDDANLN